MEGVGKIRVNPLGFEWLMIVEDCDNWVKWINNRGGIGVPATKCWQTWWDEEHKPLQYCGFFWKLLGISTFPALLIISIQSCISFTRDTVYGLSWLVIVATLTMVKARRRFGALNFRFLKLILAMVFTIILIYLFAFLGLTVGDLFASLLAFIPAGWAILQIWIPTNPWGAERLPPNIITSESEFYFRRLWGQPTEIWIPINPRGAERLPPNIITSESDFYLRRLWGQPTEKEFSKYLSSIPPDSQTILTLQLKKERLQVLEEKVAQIEGLDEKIELVKNLDEKVELLNDLDQKIERAHDFLQMLAGMGVSRSRDVG